MILLITKYNLSSRWFHLFTFLILYLICLKMHYIDLNNNNLVECMMKNSTNSPNNSDPLEGLTIVYPKKDNFISSNDDIFIDFNDDILSDFNDKDTRPAVSGSVDIEQIVAREKILKMELKLDMLEADVKTLLSNHIEVSEAIDISNFVTIDQLHKSHQDVYTSIENNFKKELNTVSTLQTELTNEINTRKALETRVTDLEKELRDINRSIMVRNTMMDSFMQQYMALHAMKQTGEEVHTAIVPR